MLGVIPSCYVNEIKFSANFIILWITYRKDKIGVVNNHCWLKTKKLVTCIAISSSMMPLSLPFGPIFLFSASSHILFPTDSLRPGFCEHKFLYICRSLPDGNFSMPDSRSSLNASRLLFQMDRQGLITLKRGS